MRFQSIQSQKYKKFDFLVSEVKLLANAYVHLPLYGVKWGLFKLVFGYIKVRGSRGLQALLWKEVFHQFLQMLC